MKKVETSDSRKSIRPRIPVIMEPHSSAEKFQNTVLRPILKMQNDLLISIFRHFMDKRKVPFRKMSTQKKNDQIAHSLSKDNRLRGLLLGAVIGHFTTEELEEYLTDEAELKKRIITLMTQRLQDQCERVEGKKE